MAATPDDDAVAEEQRRADRLRRVVDVACALLRQGGLARAEGEALAALVREQALALFPGREDVFDLVLAPRFLRILDEFCPGGRVLPFSPPGYRLTQVKSRITPPSSK